MKRLAGWTRVVVMGLWALQLCMAAFSQDEYMGQHLGTSPRSSRTGQTAGLGDTEVAAAKSGKAGGTGNLLLGGERRTPYRLNQSDVVTLSFTLSPEFDQVLTIQPDGYVSLKDAEPVLARGLTLEEFREAVRKSYAGYLHDPQVAVALKEFEHPYFVAGGEVVKPGKYELRADITVIEAVEIAGGFTHDAKHSQVVLFRRINDDSVEARVFDLKRMLKEKKLSEASLLRPGDMVFVPQNSISKVEHFLSKPSLSMYVSSTQF
jgi:polysaccharide biosynthesis/export protein